MDVQIARLDENSPQREWLCRCADDDEEIATCTAGVAGGDIEVFGPENEGFFRLHGSEIAVFRRALDEAIAVAREDIARKTAAQVKTKGAAQQAAKPLRATAPAPSAPAPGEDSHVAD